MRIVRLVSLAIFAVVAGLAGAAAQDREIQQAAATPELSARACLADLDRQVADAKADLARCSTAIAATGLPVAERAGAFLVRAKAHAALSDAAAARADYQQAVQLFTAAIDPTAANPTLVFYRAVAYHALGDVEHAEKDYDFVIVNNPRNAVALVDRAILLSRLKGEVITAGADFDQAVAAAPNDADVRLARAEFQYLRGQFNLAAADYDAVLKLDPSRPLALYGRGRARLHLGDTANGNADLAAARALDAGVDRAFTAAGLKP